MALTKAVQLFDSFGEEREFTNAYIRVDLISGGKENMLAQVCIYRSATDSRVLKSIGYQFAPQISGENFIAQAYQYLKTIPEFADAEDC